MTADVRSQATPERPWLGLARFTEAERDYFYGRDTEIAELRDRVLRAPLTVLYGVSGYGKSSLLGAGLVPTLREEGLLPVTLPRFVFDDPARTLLAQVLETAYAALPPIEGVAPLESTSLWEFFHDRTLPWWQPGYPGHVQPVLIFDQFEDVFTQGEDKGGACALASREFLTAIADLVENRPPSELRERLKTDRALVRAYDFQARPVKIVLALRGDFLGRLERWRRVMPSLVENRLELRRLTGVQALRAVLEPASKRPDRPPIVETATGAAIVRFVAGVPSDIPLEEIDNVPPLLSLICAQLNERRFPELNAETPEREDLPIAWVDAPQSDPAVANAPGQRHTAAEEVLERFYSSSFGEHPESVRIFVEDELVSNTGFRETVTLDTAHATLLAAGVRDPRAALSRLVDQRLLVIEDRGGTPRVELTHDVVASLARLSRDERREAEALARAQAEKLFAEQKAEQIRIERNRLRRLAIIAGACAAVAAIAGVFGWISMVKARQRQAEADAGFAAARITTDLSLARIADEKLAYVPGIQDLREEMARKAVEQYSKLLSQRPGDTDVTIGLLNARANRAEIMAQIGTYTEAIDAFELCLSDIRASHANARYSERLALLLPKTQLGYYRFLDANNAGKENHERLKDAITALEAYLSTHTDPGAALQLARAYILRGYKAPKEMTEAARQDFGKARVLCERLLEADSNNAEVLDRLSAAIHNFGLELQIAKDYAGALTMMDEAEVLQLRALALQPDHPLLMRNHTVGQLQKARLLQLLPDRAADAAGYFQRAVTLGRRLAENNPRVTLYQWELASDLKEHAVFLNRQADREGARRCYTEAIEILERMVTKRDDRPTYGRTLLEMLPQVAEFEQFGKPAGSEKASGPETAARTRQKAIEIGRELVHKYPDALALNFAFGKALSRQATYEPVSNDEKQAAALLEEAIVILAPRLQREDGLSSDQVASYLGWVDSLENILEKQAEVSKQPGINEKRVAILDAALMAAPLCTSTDSKQQLMSVGNRRAQLHLASGQAAEAVALGLRLIAIGEPSYREKPYLYYLRESLGGQYKNLALAYQALGMKQEELHAWQQWIRILIIPQFGANYDDLLAAELPPTDENLKKLRNLTTNLPGMKKLTIPCDVNGVKIPVQFYITNAVPGPDFDPLVDQARWIEEERGVTVPEDVRDALRKLAAIAHENKKGLADLVTLALESKDPLDEPRHRLEAAQRNFREQEAEANALVEARRKLTEAHTVASQTALENLKWKELEQFSRAWREFDPASATALSKLALALLFQKERRDEACRIYEESWGARDGTSAFAKAAAADFEALTKVPEGNDVLWKILTAAREHNRSFPDILRAVLDELAKETPADPPLPEPPRLESKQADVEKARKALKTQETDLNRRQLASALGGAAFAAVFEKRFEDAIIWSNEALAIVASLDEKTRDGLVFIHGNLAHALLFSGKFDEALAVYRAHWEKPMRGRFFKDAVIEDFAMFEKAHLTHPDFVRMRQALGLKPAGTTKSVSKPSTPKK
jgi:tetratricopeptide (TPR) repeat protein